MALITTIKTALEVRRGVLGDPEERFIDTGRGLVRRSVHITVGLGITSQCLWRSGSTVVSGVPTNVGIIFGGSRVHSVSLCPNSLLRLPSQYVCVRATSQPSIEHRVDVRETLWQVKLHCDAEKQVFVE